MNYNKLTEEELLKLAAKNGIGEYADHNGRVSRQSIIDALQKYDAHQSLTINTFVSFGSLFIGILALLVALLKK